MSTDIGKSHVLPRKDRAPTTQPLHFGVTVEPDPTKAKFVSGNFPRSS